VERQYELEAIDAAVAGVGQGGEVFLMFGREPGLRIARRDARENQRDAVVFCRHRECGQP
jgi:hypothetical protein